MFLAYMSIMVMVTGGSLFLTPVLLQQPSFGIIGETEEEFQQKVSRDVALVSIPVGLLQVVVAIGLYVPVTKRCGEVPTLTVMGLIGTCAFPLMGTWCDTMWKVAFVNAILGTALGFLTPALGPIA